MQPSNLHPMSPRSSHSPTVRVCPAVHSLALVIHAMILLGSAAMAATPDIVGTWRKSDRSIVEFKPDGSVMTGTAPVGRWERLRDSPKYVLRFNGASTREFYYVTTGRHKRQLTLELPSIGTRTNLDRVDNGPTINPDAPDEREAMELEYTEALASIARTSEALGRAQAEAAEAWQKHYYARSIGRISGWIPIAQRKEAEAKGLESSLHQQRESLKKMAVNLGKPIPPEASASNSPAPAGQFQPGQPSQGRMPVPSNQRRPGQPSQNQMPYNVIPPQPGQPQIPMVPVVRPPFITN